MAFFYIITTLLALAATLNAAGVDLGTASLYCVIASSTLTSTGLSVLNCNVAIFPDGASSITGFLPGIITGITSAADSAARTAHGDAMTAYTSAAALPPTIDLTGQDLGGKTLGPGVYSFSSSVGITGILTLDARNDPLATFIFQIGSTLTTATAAQVVLINGARPCSVIWQVGSSATLGTATQFIGNILALASVTVNSNVIVNGGLYALTAAVTLINDQINLIGGCAGGASPVIPSVVAIPSVTAVLSVLSIPSVVAVPSVTAVLSVLSIPSVVPVPSVVSIPSVVYIPPVISSMPVASSSYAPRYEYCYR